MKGNDFDFEAQFKGKEFRKKNDKFPTKLVVGAAIGAFALLLGSMMVKTVPPGHVGVVALFGKVKNEPYKPGLHVANPLFHWTFYDVRQKTHQESANVPTQDQLETSVDMSLQYNIIGDLAPIVLEETGTAEAAIEVHLVPKLRSALREQAKSIKRAEDFFLEETQDRLQGMLLETLREYLRPKGIYVDAVLIRDIRLPEFITAAIESKKEREQAAERQKAELERFRTEQQQKIAAAEATRAAAEQDAERQKVLADAKAYEIQKVNEAIGANPLYLQLQAMEALKQISKDPAAKIYFMNGESSNPLPLMHLGDPNKR
jgi:regulator of protease activity HflC (stomatin/prohibitin superfamily)